MNCYGFFIVLKQNSFIIICIIMISYPFLLYSLLHKIRKGSFSSDFNHKRFKFQYLFRNTFFLFYFFFKSLGETNL